MLFEKVIQLEVHFNLCQKSKKYGRGEGGGGGSLPHDGRKSDDSIVAKILKTVAGGLGRGAVPPMVFAEVDDLKWAQLNLYKKFKKVAQGWGGGGGGRPPHDA